MKYVNTHSIDSSIDTTNADTSLWETLLFSVFVNQNTFVSQSHIVFINKNIVQTA